MSDDACSNDITVRNGRSVPHRGDGGSDLDRFFEALADDHRRRVLICLQCRGTVGLQDLADFLADQEDIDRGGEAFERLQINLVHLHLPKLADHGLLSFDQRTNTISDESLPKAVEEILDLAAGLEGVDGSDPATESE